jgi:hypothetical protein
VGKYLTTVGVVGAIDICRQSFGGGHAASVGSALGVLITVVGILVGLIGIICCWVVGCWRDVFVGRRCAPWYYSTPLRECRQRLNEGRHDGIVSYCIALHGTRFPNSSFFESFVLAFKSPESHDVFDTRDDGCEASKRLKRLLCN